MKRALPILAIALLAGVARAEDARKAPWDSEVVELFRSIPIQESGAQGGAGRIKPIDTLAGFKLLKLRGVRRCPTKRDGSGESLDPTQWLLDVFFYPEQAAHYEVFQVLDSDVMDAIGVPHANKNKRDRYSWAELEPGLERLRELAKEYAPIEEKNRTSVQQQVIELFHNTLEYSRLAHTFDFARAKLPLRGTPELDAVFAPTDSGFTVFLAKVEGLHGKVAPGSPTWPPVQTLLDVAQEAAAKAEDLIIFPPSDPQNREWLSPAHILVHRLQTDEPLDRQIALLAMLEQLDHVKGNQEVFKETLKSVHAGIRQLADSRGEWSKIPLEVTFYKSQFFYNALVLFGLSFLLVALSWLWPANLLKKGSAGLLGLAIVLLVTGIVFRCIIRSRPPVSTLYETILFITAVAVVVSCAIEWINRQGIAISVAPLLGTLGMFLATKYEFKEAVTAGDTMISLQAVLDTNFWLATHVTAVTTGYSAGLLAAAIAQVWLVGKMVGYRKGDDEFYKGIARMTYGVLCFGLLFSTVGTILGGIWANYSWGRFWGWDPKENGALLICLWELIILHARMGGYIRDHGLCALATLGAIVIAFSWWGVNLLGVGLHAYGFTTGIRETLIAFCLIEAAVVFASGVWKFLQSYTIVVQSVAKDAPGSEPVAGAS